MEYDAAGLTTRYKVNSSSPAGSGCIVPPMTAVFDSTKDWRYRHGANGLREQRRLCYSPAGDSCQCIHEWTYYLRGAGGEVRAVWSGRQNADLDYCDNTITRRVVLYPMEYMGAGGANYVRDASGNWVKEFRITDYLGSVRTAIQSTAGAALNYTPYGKPSNTTDRWSYLGQEKDRETIGLNEFDYRKYQSETGSFLRPDPLWSLAPEMSSFVYGNASPLVYSDPSGLTTNTDTPLPIDIPITDAVPTDPFCTGGGDGFSPGKSKEMPNIETPVVGPAKMPAWEVQMINFYGWRNHDLGSYYNTDPQRGSTTPNSSGPPKGSGYAKPGDQIDNGQDRSTRSQGIYQSGEEIPKNKISTTCLFR